MSDKELSLLKDKVRWQDLALCPHFPPSIFFEEYELDARTARLADDICMSCPVRVQCLQAGMENGEWGVWGGAFLVSGKIDGPKNAHKTPEQLKIIKDSVGQSV